MTPNAGPRDRPEAAPAELTLAEASARFNIPVTQLRRRAATGRLAGARLVRTSHGDEWRVPVAALERLGAPVAERGEEHAPAAAAPAPRQRSRAASDGSDDKFVRERDEISRERSELSTQRANLERLRAELREAKASGDKDLERQRADLERLRGELRQAKASTEKELEEQRASSVELERLVAERGRLEAERRANEELLARVRAESARGVERHHQIPAEESAARVFLAAEAKELARERRALQDEWTRLEAAKDDFAAQRLAAHADAGRDRARRAAQT